MELSEMFSKKLLSNSVDNGNGNNKILEIRKQTLNRIDQQQLASNAELASYFECPVCFEYILPPILQCQNGHLVCKSCRQRLTICPTCRVQITANIRNLQMEKVATSILFPCKYVANGCPMQTLVKDKVVHEEMCEFKPYNCPCPGINFNYYFIIFNYYNYYYCLFIIIF